MDMDSEIYNFEQALRNNNMKKVLLYGDKKIKENYAPLNPTEVIRNVSQQIKAINDAEFIKTSSTQCILNTHKNVTSSPVNILEEPKPVHTRSNNFDTEYVYDTQLLNIIDNGEFVNVPLGVTQEFETTFAQILENKELPMYNKDRNNERIENFDDIKKSKCSIEINRRENTLIRDNPPGYGVIDRKETEKCNKNKNQINQAYPETLDPLSSLKDVVYDFGTKNISKFGETNIKGPSSSPVLKSINKKSQHRTCSLTFELEFYEQFEAIAVPIINTNSKFEDAKRIINSQIKNDKLLYQDNIIKSKKTIEELDTTTNTESGPKQKDKFYVSPINDNSDNKLFSNDEEADYINSQDKEIPLTCALETSLSKETHILDKTMYVGFQTASNRSIQVFTDSFSKAKTIFSSINEKPRNDLSLSELVEVYDSISSKKCDATKFTNESAIITPNNQNSVFNINNETAGFQTASGSPITISEKAWIKSKDIFNDIDSFNKDNENINPGKLSTKHIISHNKEATNDANVNDLIPIREEVKEQKQNLMMIEKPYDLNTQEQINIDECIMREFEENLLYADDKKLHTNTNKICSSTSNYINETEDEKRIPSTLDLHCNNLTNINNIFEEELNQVKGIFTDIGVNSINKSSEHMIFVGFKTANNKNIKISKEALAKSENIFNEIAINDLPQIAPNNGSFCAINKNKTCATSTKSKLFNNNSTSAMGFTKEKQNKVHNLNKNTLLEFSGFRKANNKPIHISKEALVKSDKILQDIDFKSVFSDKHVDVRLQSKLLKDNEIHLKARKSEHIETVNDTRQILVETKNILKDLNDKRNITDIVVNINKTHIHNSTSDLVGFKTASNKFVKISDEAFVKNTIIFQDILRNENDKYTQNNELDEFSTKTQTVNNFFCYNAKSESLENAESILNIKSGFKGFQTASNKKIVASKDALRKTKKIFEHIEFDLPNQITSEIICDPVLNISKKPSDPLENLINVKADLNINTGFKGFQTASNKRVNVSEEALRKTKKIFENIEFALPNQATCTSEIIYDPVLNISKKPSVPLENVTNVKVDLNINTGFKGFQTASNKRVNVSEEALRKTKKIFENIEFDLPNQETCTSEIIRDPVLNISKKPGVPLENATSVIADLNINTGFKGFQTANNKKVNVSDEALRKTKQIFEDIEFTLPECAIVTNKLICDSALKTSKKSSAVLNNSISNFKDTEIRELTNLDNIINAEVVKHFDEINTEDFFIKSPATKRPGSPILSCPRAKKTKFSARIVKNNIEDKNEKLTSEYVFRDDYKTYKKYNLRDVQEIENQFEKSKPIQDINYNFETINNFKFHSFRNEITHVKWSTDDIKSHFIQSVNKNIIPDGWIDNHLKLIILKLIFYENKFPNAVGYVCTVRNVLEQLKYRYKRELYNVERPALRKILEKDEVPNKRIVLSILSIYVNGESVKSATNIEDNIELLLSDGWYCVRTIIDKMLCKFVCNGKIGIGTKLITHGAELMNCEQGLAPWEDISSVRLKIFGNSTRRAHWTARLGFHANCAILSHLTAVKPEGGKISRLRVFVTRVYPMLFVEKFDDGSTVTRSERLENLHQTKYEADREIQLEKVYEEVQQEFNNVDSQDSEVMDFDKKTVESGSQIWRLMKKSRDPAEFRGSLTHSQANLLQEYTIRRRDNTLQELQAKVQERLRSRGLDVTRNVVPMLKVRVADVYNMETTKALITIWKPNESLLDIIKEGVWIDIYNVVPTGVRYSETQISAGRHSIFRNTSKINEINTNMALGLQRKCYTVSELALNPFMTTEYNEIDTVGFVFDIEPPIEEFDNKKQLFQNVYLADADKRIVCVNFWGGVKMFGFENILDTGQVVACVNLQKRSGNSKKNIPQYRATELTYFTKTCKTVVIRKMCDDLSKTFSSLDRRKFIDDCVAIKNNFTNKKNNIENISPYRFNNSDFNMSKNKPFIDSPVGDSNLNLSGLDFESTFKQTDTELSPNTLRRKMNVNKKIAQLKKYGEPPPLSSIHLINKSKDAVKPYKSPLISKNECHITNQKLQYNNSIVRQNPAISSPTNPTTSNVASELNSTHRSTSPVFPFRSRIINPIKLNFSKRNNESKEDPFGEDFESSPPLSLD